MAAVRASVVIVVACAVGDRGRISLAISAKAARVLVDSVDEEGCIFVAKFSIAVATVPATVSSEFAMLDMPSPAETRRALVGSLSGEAAAAALLRRLRPAARCSICMSGLSSS
jgi:hypothetical protein